MLGSTIFFINSNVVVFAAPLLPYIRSMGLAMSGINKHIR
jgi:hypothetical protein